jgi:hypothetical protein
MFSNPSPTIIRALRKERDELSRKRAEAVAGFDREIAEIDAVLGGITPKPSATPLPCAATRWTQQQIASVANISARSLNQMAIEVCQHLLKNQQLKTSDLFAAIVDRGIYLKAEDPERRLVQLLSENKDIFQSDRKNGWSLKGESSGGTELSGASASEKDDQQ